MSVLPTPSDVIALYALSQPEEPAVSDLSNGSEWNYQQFDALVNQIANALIKKGCISGDRITVMSRNSGFQVALYFACIRIGCIYTPLNWRLSVAEIAQLIARAEPRLVFCDSVCAHLGKDASSIEEFEQECAKEAPEVGYPQQTDADRPALILFTSGTSGHPKGVLLSLDNLINSGHSFTQLTNVSRSSRFLCEAPMFHTIGLVANIWPVLLCGGSIVVSDGFEPERTLNWLSDEDLFISHYVGVPQMIEAFRRQEGFDASKLKRLTALVTGGAPHAQADILQWLDEGVTLVSGFGMSESGSVLGMPPNIPLIKRKTGSVGVPSPNIELRIVDEQGVDCELGEAGELWLRGRSILQNYYNDQEATEKAFAEGQWFKSGDIVRCDEDGFFWIVDRKKDMFISGGENIYPAEIEAVLGQYPGLKEYAVVGIEDEKWGEVGCIFAVPENSLELDQDAIFSFLKEHLASYKIPKKLVVKGSLPRTSTGKLKKALLK